MDPNVDPYSYLGMVRNSDGSITRLQELTKRVAASSDNSSSISTSILTKDLSINESKKTWARLILPREALESTLPSTKFPFVVYFHGGGFILCSADSEMFQDFYTAITVDLPAVVVSVDYRLAPEHRLPVAYEDCMEALHWIKTSDDDWLTRYADFSKCYLMGTSAGGNIAYHVGLRAAACVNDLMPLQIKGLILHHAFFGGTRRTPSESRLARDIVLPLCVSDVMWEASLPLGVDRDHEYSNPTAGIESRSDIFDEIRSQRWKILVTGCNGDPSVDREIELVDLLKQKGLDVVGKFEEGGCHGIELFDPLKAKALCMAIKEMLDS